MSDMTTDQQLRRTMKAIVDTAPEAPDVLEPTLVPARPQRRVSNVLVAAAAFVTVLVVVGGLSMLLFAGNPETDMAGGTPPADDGSPPVTTAESDLVTDSAAAVLWNELVDQALADAGIDLEVTRSYETETPVADGGSVTAAIDDSDGQLVFVADLQAWADGEYQSDPEWQAEVAGSTEPGSTVPEGTLFVLDERQTTATTIQTIVLVSENGLLTIKAEKTSSMPLIDVESLESVTRSLGGDIAELTQSNTRDQNS